MLLIGAYSRRYILVSAAAFLAGSKDLPCADASQNLNFPTWYGTRLTASLRTDEREMSGAAGAVTELTAS